ncbi:MAG: PEGA domain-containing protein, partial [Myxococcota bacterium]
AAAAFWFTRTPEEAPAPVAPPPVAVEAPAPEVAPPVEPVRSPAPKAAASAPAKEAAPSPKAAPSPAPPPPEPVVAEAPEAEPEPEFAPEPTEFGYLGVASDPRGLEVIVGGVSKGKTPLRMVRMPVGAYDVVVRDPATGRSKTVPATVLRNQTANLTVKLD